jgi:hypothetical protein
VTVSLLPGPGGRCSFLHTLRQALARLGCESLFAATTTARSCLLQQRLVHTLGKPQPKIDPGSGGLSVNHAKPHQT